MKQKKILQIVRHAKSSWDFEDISDIDRPLKLRGIKNAYEMARRIKIRRKIPELMVSSPANRALHTAAIFMRVFELPFKQLNVIEKIYGTDHNTLIDIIRGLDSQYNNVMIFGHNPECTALANYFSGETIIELPTCGMVTIELNIDNWGEASSGNVLESYCDFPKKELQVESF